MKKVVISGSSGFVGQHLMPALKKKGYAIVKLVRRTPESEHEFFWDPDNGQLDPSVFEGAEAVINLSGENIMAARWSDSFKKKLEDSRLKSTNLLVEAISKAKVPPKSFINASAIGYYSQKVPTPADEDTAAGKDFLAKLSEKWEEAALNAQKYSRVVLIRIGVVLGKEGGALQKMLTPFKIGLGGVVASGKQYMSWIDIDDLVSIFIFAIDKETLTGPVNAVSPNVVTNKEFTKTLGKVLSRPTLFPLPGFAAKLLFGEVADAVLIHGRHVVPKKLIDSEFTFDYPYLEQSLKHLLR